MRDKGYFLEDLRTTVGGHGGLQTFLKSKGAVISYGVLSEDEASLLTRELEFTLSLEPSPEPSLNKLHLWTKEEVIPIDIKDYRYSPLRELFNLGYRLERECEAAKQFGLKAHAGLRIKNGGIGEALDYIRHLELS